ncbi:MAG TPA: alpha-ketoglutarate-dependent dioxygenase AlkB [Acidimicrobiales bacterium]|nr:alpha-ketoglutarate-dependent dioxygenase AlkB [Acidimicrobiales bacterium]
MVASPLIWQPSLLCGGEPRVDEGFGDLTRTALDDASWVDHCPGWVSGSDQLFSDLVADIDWDQRSRWLYDRRVTEPRLTASWRAGGGTGLPPVLEQARRTLSAHYGADFDSCGMNLYRDGADSVAWHRDRIPPEVADPVVALVSLGEPRTYLLRRLGGGASRSFRLGRGDLLVTGGRTQRSWEHAVPKVAAAGPRLSLAFRHRARLPAGTPSLPGPP